MKIPMLDLISQYNSIKQDIDKAITDVLNSGAYIMGYQVRQFEEHMEEFLGVKHAIGVASGSDALLLSLHALGIGMGDKVIVPTFTFFATASAVTRMGAIPIFVDIDPETYNLDLDQVRDLLKHDKDIEAIIPVHLFGLPVDMNRLMELAKEYDLRVIEDACQAINANIEINTEMSVDHPDHKELMSVKKAGTIGNTGCFSFFPSKNLGGFGDGGMIVTNDDQLAEKLRILRVHGSQPKYHHSVVGYNSRLDTIQAAILDVKLNYLNEWTDKRRNVATHYNGAFQTSGVEGKVKWPQLSPGHVFHQYVIESDSRDQLAEHLKAKGIASSIYYPIPLHLQQCFAKFGYKSGQQPNAEKACKKVLALPIDPELTESEVEYIVRIIKDFINK
jgi:dTDP-4-amino-4,6-dideoxygalactose transaminase